MSKHWDPQRARGWQGSTKWLSPEDYRALSPKAKRALNAARGRSLPARRTNDYFPDYGEPSRLGHHLASFSVTSLLVIAAVLVLTDLRYGWVRLPGVGGSIAEASAPIRASFGYCKWGGGTNCVVDGDTVWIGGEDVRIANIDAPETHDYGCDSELQLGEEAASRLQSLLNSGAVTMTTVDRDEDVYGRKLRTVAVNGHDVGDMLVSAGLARPWEGHRRPWC